MLPNNNLSHSFPSGPSYDDIENFMTAAKNGQVDVVENFLNQYGAAIVNAEDNIKARAITWAAWGGCDDVIKLLLNRGAEIDAHGTSGKTALSWAAEMGKLETFALLLDRGAKLDDKDDSGTTPMEYAKRSFNTAITDYIDQHLEEQANRVRQAEQKKTMQEERDAREAVAERLRRLKEGAGGKFKIAPQHKGRNNRGPGR